MYIHDASIEFLQDNKHIVIQTRYKVEVWNIENSSLRTRITEDVIGAGIYSIAIFPKSSLFLVGARGVACIFDLYGNEIQRIIPPFRLTKYDPHIPIINGACISDDERTLITSFGKHICFWDTNTWHLQFRLKYRFSDYDSWDTRYHQPEYLTLCNKNRFLISAGMYGDTMIWDLKQGDLLYNLLFLKDFRLLPEFGDWTCDVSIIKLPDKHYVLLCIDYLHMVHITTGTTFGSINIPNYDTWRTYKAALSVERKKLVLVGEHQFNKPRCLTVDLRTLAVIHDFAAPSFVWALSPNGQTLAFATHDTLQLFDTQSGILVKNIPIVTNVPGYP